MGLTPESLARANFVVRNPLAGFHGGLSYDELSYYEQQHYKIESERYLASLDGPQLLPQNPELVAREQQQKDLLRTGRPQPWHMPVSEMLNDGLMFTVLGRAPMAFVAAQGAYSSIEAGGQLYQNREQLSLIWQEAQANRGITLAAGPTFAGTFGNLQGAVAFGGWGSLDFDTWEFNAGVYGTIEGGPKIGPADMSYDPGLESTIFTTRDYESALKGHYMLYGAGYNQTSFSMITAAGGKINGYQFTLDNSRYNKSYMKYEHDPSTYISSGFGYALGGKKDD